MYINKKGFTLIELLAVIVVLAILALVVTPIVLNIVENAQTGSDERSLEQYAKVLMTTYYQEKMEDTSLKLEDFLNDVDNFDSDGVVTMTYNGSVVVCPINSRSVASGDVVDVVLKNCTIDARGLYKYEDGKAEKCETKKENGVEVCK